MANPPPDADGMGSTPSGPSFAPGSSPPGWPGSSATGRPGSGPAGPPSSGPEPSAPGSTRAPYSDAYRPPHSRRPAVVTALAVGVVALVVVVSSLIAHRADQNVTAEPRRSVSVPRVTAVKDSIEFSSRSGAGRLTIVDHTWSEARSDPGVTLQLQIRIECTSGTVGYDPYDFQAFDSAGNLFDLAGGEVSGALLGVGVLQPGEQTSGSVAFVIPRGQVTLLMSDNADSVTALRVPD